MPELASAPETIVYNLSSFASEFGITVDEEFDRRVASIGFVNVGVLAAHDSEAAGNLETLLSEDPRTRSSAPAGAGESFVADYKEGIDWISVVGRLLDRRWNQTVEGQSTGSCNGRTKGRLLHAIRTGLAVFREKPDFAKYIEEKAHNLGEENRFLSGRLLYWSDRKWKLSRLIYLWLFYFRYS